MSPFPAGLSNDEARCVPVWTIVHGTCDGIRVCRMGLRRLDYHARRLPFPAGGEAVYGEEAVGTCGCSINHGG